MSSSSFRERFQLLDRIADGAVQSHQALAHTGVVVMVHLLPPETGAANPLLERVRRVEGRPDSKVMEVTEDDGRPVVVTRFILDFESFEGWLDSVDPEGVVPSGQTDPAGPEAGALDDAGEFTRMFKAMDASEGGAGGADSSAPQSREPEVADDAPEGAQDDAPGEFTREFKRREALAAREKAASEEAAPEEAGQDQPADQGPTPEQAPAPEPDTARSDPPTDEPGEFTRMFKAVDPGAVDSGSMESGTRDPGESTPEGPQAKDPPPEDSSPKRRPPEGPKSERTTPERPSAPAPPPPPPPPQRASPPAPSSPTPPATPAEPAPPPPPSRSPEAPPTPETPAKPPAKEKDGPGDFTREMRRQQRPDASGAPSPPRMNPGSGSSAPPPPPPGGAGRPGAPPPPATGGDWRNRIADDSDRNREGVSRGPGAPATNLPRDDGPSDYTRVIRGVSRPDSGPPSGSPPPPPPRAGGSGGSSFSDHAPPSSKPIWPLVLGLVLMVILAVALVVAVLLLTGGNGAE